MLARLYVQLPFVVSVPENTQFKLYNFVSQGYTIRTYPPKRSKKVQQPDGKLSINEVIAYNTDILQIDFCKKEFERSVNGPCDPPTELIRDFINFFLIRLRFVTRSPNIRQIDFPLVSWNLQYLNDDESELDETPGLLRRRFGRKFTFSWTALNPDVWNDVHTLPPEFIPPQWEILLLDANAAMPNAGLSIVLAYTALEVFICQILNKLAEKSTVPKKIWSWINKRDWLKQPSVDEQFSDLLRILGCVSLKENGDLWKAYKNIQQARNKFVHEGDARIGSKKVEEQDALNLIIKASQIIAYIKKNLPEELKWPEFKHKLKIQFEQKLIDVEKKDEKKKSPKIAKKKETTKKQKEQKKSRNKVNKKKEQTKT